MSVKMLIQQALNMEDGDSAKVRRLFPIPGFRNYDPFVLLDEFFVDPSSGFPTHPHRGFEAVTYIIKGGFRHQDNLGNDTTVFGGGAQRFTAGKGLSHSEMPVSEGIAHGFQLWINLPKRLKDIDPEYQQVDPKDIPEEEGDGCFIRNIIGNNSPVQIKTPVMYQDITLKKDKKFTIEINKDYKGIIYLFEGKLSYGEGTLPIGSALLLKSLDRIMLTAQEESRFIFLMGQPHNEPIKQWGPYVD